MVKVSTKAIQHALEYDLGTELLEMASRTLPSSCDGLQSFYDDDGCLWVVKLGEDVEELVKP
jgi:hypothetical protein